MHGCGDNFQYCDAMFDSIVLRGNEIEFKYNGKSYFILPHYDQKQKNTIGVCFGEAFQDDEIICLTKNDLHHVLIQGNAFSAIIHEIEITWKNFEWCGG